MPNTKMVPQKSEIIEYYDLTKGGVESLDEKCVNYCIGGHTRRRSMTLFFRILDISGAILYSINPIKTIRFYEEIIQLSRETRDGRTT